jgi:hypothetical protein
MTALLSLVRVILIVATVVLLPLALLVLSLGGPSRTGISALLTAASLLLYTLWAWKPKPPTCPDPFTSDQDALDAAHDELREELRFVSEATTKKALHIEGRGKAGDPLVVRDEGSRRRIDSWLAATTA